MNRQDESIMPHHVLFDPPLNETRDLPEHDSWPQTKHRFDKDSVSAVNAAIASERPLLCRGEPGSGKSQLARAAAEFMQVPFLPFVVDERTERDDLFHTFDAVARLAQAQVSALVAQQKPEHDWLGDLAEQNFFRPGVLWWAFAWDEAAEQAERFSKHCRKSTVRAKPEDWTPTAPDRVCGPVVLIDEIDKADPSVPNGLLECLGNRGFQTAQLEDSISLAKGAKPPLVIITTNEDRELPAAFLRRCLVLHMNFQTDPDRAKSFLLNDRARVHWKTTEISDDVCHQVSESLLKARAEADRMSVPKPGAAEFLDILRVLVRLASGESAAQLALLAEISHFALKKQAETGT